MQSGTRCPFQVRRLRYDPAFALEVGWCSDHGLPHSTLLSWSAEDRAKLTGYLLESAARCQMCGTAPWEWDPEQGGDRRAYEAASNFCMGCHTKAAAQDDEPVAEGTTIVLVPARVAAARREDSHERDG